MYPLTITAANSTSPDAVQPFVLTVLEAPAITSPNATTFTVGVPGSFDVTTAHDFPVATTLSIGPSVLPSGVIFVDNGDGSATLAGTPAAGSGDVYPLTITVDNGVAPIATQGFTLTVLEAPVITSPAATTFTVGAAGTFSVTTAHNFPAPTSLSIGDGVLPAGVTFVDNGNGTATLAGTPATATGRIYPLTITAGNTTGPDGTQAFTLTVDQAPAITSANATPASVGVTSSFTVTSTGFPVAALSESGPLPNGLAWVDNGDGTGMLSGLPASGSDGIYPITFTADNGVAPVASQSFTLTVYSRLLITTTAVPTGIASVAYSTQLLVAGGKPGPGPSYHWAVIAGALPSGISLNGATGILAGTTTQAGTFAFTVSAADSLAVTVSADLRLVIFPSGLWMVGSDGGVFTVGAAPYLGSLPGLGVHTSGIVGMTSTPDGKGYWLLGSDGGVFTFGDAAYFGSVPGLGVHTSGIVGMTSTPDGNGYWLLGSDGGVFTFGDAAYFGSVPGLGVHTSGVVAMGSTPDGNGYWLLGSDGGVFTFGDAAYFGSVPGLGVHTSGVVAMGSTPDGNGYWLLGSDGGVFTFGDAAYFGSVPGLGVHASNLVGMVRLADGAGYWLIGADGRVFAFGDAVALPGLSSPPAHPVIGDAAS